MTSYIALKDAAIGYTKPLIENINAELYLGDICLMIGNNGVGKTTLLKTLLAQIPLLKGEVVLDGQQLKSYSSDLIAKKISIVFSKSDIPTKYTVHDLVSFGKYIHYPYYFKLENKDELEIDEIIVKLNLQEFRNTLLVQLSDGNLQKAFIGRALAQNSPIIILDEPTTHLDEDNKIMILQLLRSLAEREQKLILFSSHDWRLAKEFADKIWFIKDQKLQAGIAEDIIITNAELAAPQLFNIHPKFVAPKISAPELPKELLYSFLQKNFQNDLSEYEFSYINGVWKIIFHNQEHTVNKFADISNHLLNK